MSQEASVDASPAEIRAARAVGPRAPAWWGMILTVAVLATMYAALYFSYVYVRIGVQRWPPAGIDPPALGLAGASVAALLASAGALWAGLRHARRGGLGAERSGLVIALVLAGQHLWLLYADWQQADFAVDAHSYTALFYVLPAIHATALSLGMLMAATHLALSLRPVDQPRREVGLRALGAYWYCVAASGAVLIGVVYLLPRVWPEL